MLSQPPQSHSLPTNPDSSSLVRELEVRKETLSLALECAQMGAFDFDLRTKNARRTPRYDEIFGYEESDQVWTIPLLLQHVLETDRGRVEAQLREAIGMRGRFNTECRIQRADGSVRWIALRGSALSEENGATRLTGVALDITERKLAEETIQRTAEELSRSNKDLEQFAYVSSHDLKEPLRMVCLYMDLILREYAPKLDERGSQYLSYAAEGARRMIDLIDGLLDYSRIGSERGHDEPFSVKVAVQKALENLKTSLVLNKAEVQAGELPVIKANPVLLTQLFQNLISNSIKFKGQDLPKIEIAAERDGNDWVFSVKDNGIGIAPVFQEKIFAIFQRLHSRDEYPGTGIGLSVCKRIVERSGGRIWVKSEEGQGATFLFTLPAD